MLEYVFLAVGVLKAHVVELDIAIELFPIFAFLVEAVAVLFYHLGRVLDVAFALGKRGEPFDIHLDRNKIGYRVDRPLYRLDYALRVRHEHRQRAYHYYALLRDDAAVPQHQRERDRRGEGYERGEQRAVVSEPLSLALHRIGTFVEIVVEFLLDGERFGRSRARDALVEAARYLGIYLAAFAVELGQSAREVDRNERDYRHYHEHAKRKYRVEREHDRSRADRVYDIERALIDIPGYRRADNARIAHDARVQSADAVLIEVRHGQRLQMVERGPTHIAQQVHLHATAGKRAEVVEHARRGDKHDVQRDERRQSVERFFRDEIIYRVTLEQRREHVERSDEYRANDHRREQSFISSDVRSELAQPEKPELGRGGFRRFRIVRHAPPPLSARRATPSASRICACRCRFFRAVVYGCPVPRPCRRP